MSEKHNAMLMAAMKRDAESRVEQERLAREREERRRREEELHRMAVAAEEQKRAENKRRAERWKADHEKRNRDAVRTAWTGPRHSFPTAAAESVPEYEPCWDLSMKPAPTSAQRKAMKERQRQQGSPKAPMAARRGESDDGVIALSDEDEDQDAMVQAAIQMSLVEHVGEDFDDSVAFGNRKDWEMAMAMDPIAAANAERRSVAAAVETAAERQWSAEQRRRDFEESLRRDREKDAERVRAKRAEEAERERIEAARVAAAKAAQIRLDSRRIAASALPPEPSSDGLLLAFRFPGGNRVQRRFSASDPLGSLFVFADGILLGNDGRGPEIGSLVSECPHRVWNDTPRNVTLADAGVATRTMFAVIPAPSAGALPPQP